MVTTPSIPPNPTLDQHLNLEETAQASNEHQPTSRDGEQTLDRQLVTEAAKLSEASFAQVWNNPEDDVYDQL
jgi:hypothetical protein